jgi:hypothetical protein
MPIQGTEGDDDIQVVEEWETSGETSVEALGGDDVINFRWDFRNDEEGYPDPDPFHVVGGAGTPSSPRCSMPGSAASPA